MSHPWSVKARRPSSTPGPYAMQSHAARTRSACPLCPVAVKPGQRVARWFETDTWAHVGCLVRTLSARERT